MAAKHEVLAEIRGLRGRVPHVTGVLVATVDGLLVAHDTRDIEPETLAAMSAAQLGLGQQIALGSAQGEFRENVTRAAGGYLAVFAAWTGALLTVVAGTELNLGRLHHEARPVAERVGGLLATTAT
jgi:predicted regulator of Ras-like GTPase activity (Roadblock/LC7/MglB family)